MSNLERTRRLLASGEGVQLYCLYRQVEDKFLAAFELDGQILPIQACRFNRRPAESKVQGDSIILESRDDLPKLLLEGDLSEVLEVKGDLLKTRRMSLCCARYVPGMGEHEDFDLQLTLDTKNRNIEVDFFWST